jgi:signal transduction histidine kinase
MPDGVSDRDHYGRGMSRLLARSSEAIRTWTEDPNLRADALFAALVGVISVLEASSPDLSAGTSGADTFAYVTIVIGAASLLVRRRLPIAVLAITSTVLAIFYLRDGGDFLSLLGLSGFYAVAAHSDRRGRAWAAMLVTAPAVFALASVTLLDSPEGYDLDNAASMGSFIIGAIAFGLIVRNRRRIFADSEQRAAAAEADRQASAARAVAQERSRIAREMHDVVAHGMSVIAVQAAAAQEIVHSNPDKAAEVMGRIENVGRQSLNEMRRMLGVLRNGDDNTSASLAPQPRLTDIDAMVARSVDAGVATTLVVAGTRRDLSPGIELTAFRIVQEALTNVLKHGGPLASATVTITYEPDVVTVEVADDGRGAVSSLSDAGGGNGLIGMHERVEIYGGELAVGPRAGGGFIVRAVLPIDDNERRPSVGSSATSADGASS